MPILRRLGVKLIGDAPARASIKQTAARPLLCKTGRRGKARCRTSGCCSLKLPVKAAGKDIHQSAVCVVGRVGDELVVDADTRRSGERVAVIGLDDLFEPGMRKLPVADKNAQPSGVEELLVDAG